MIKYFVSCALLIIMHTSLFSFNCKRMNIEDAKQINYINSDVIFIGEAIKVEQTVIVFRVMEFLKGNVNVFCKVQIESNLYINIGDKCLIYANYQNESNRLVIDECSISRSFNNPLILHVYDLPPPPMNFQDDIEKFKNEMKFLELQAKIDLIEEVGWLRSKKNKEVFEIFKNKIHQTTKYLLYIFSFLFILILLFFKRCKRFHSSVK